MHLVGAPGGADIPLVPPVAVQELGDEHDPEAIGDPEGHLVILLASGQFFIKPADDVENSAAVCSEMIGHVAAHQKGVPIVHSRRPVRKKVLLPLLEGLAGRVAGGVHFEKMAMGLANSGILP